MFEFREQQGEQEKRQVSQFESVSVIQKPEPLFLLFCLSGSVSFVAMSISNARIAEEVEKGKEEIKHSHENVEAQSQVSEKNLPPSPDSSPSPSEQEEKNEQYPGGIRLVIIIVALILAVFLVRVQCPFLFPTSDNGKLMLMGLFR